MPSRWEHLLEQKPIPLIDHLVEEVAKLLSRDLASWPPPYQELDPVAGAAFADLLQPGARRPEDRVYEEAFRLTGWELEHDLAAYDDYMRNQRWREAGLSPDARPALLFLGRWLLEQLLGLAEATGNRVKRKHLRQILDRTAHHLRLRRGVPAA